MDQSAAPPPPLPPEGEGVPETGWVDPEIAAEFPGLGMRYTTLARGSGRSPEAVKARLRELSDRFYGAHAINMRQRTIPFAYRVFLRNIGLDPDEQPSPVEKLALERMKHGGFRSRNLLDDALSIAIVEVGVALRAFDADRVEGRLGIRGTKAEETIEGRPEPLSEGTLVIADEARPLGLLFGTTAEGRGVHPETTRTTLLAVQVQGVPHIAVEEALWLASSVLLEGQEQG
jgi:DNA/RNA-binding domain of Phe-tRNA-synthetase-like protein